VAFCHGHFAHFFAQAPLPLYLPPAAVISILPEKNPRKRQNTQVMIIMTTIMIANRVIRMMMGMPMNMKKRIQTAPITTMNMKTVMIMKKATNTNTRASQ
jgi:hypothetical protein